MAPRLGISVVGLNDRLLRLERLRRAVGGEEIEPDVCRCLVRQIDYRHALADLAPDEATRQCVADERRHARCTVCGLYVYSRLGRGIRVVGVDLSGPLGGVPTIRQRLEDAP